jgi:hypothetical protein
VTTERETSGLELNRPGHAAATAARRAGDSRWIDRLARIGLAGRGLVYILIALLAFQLVVGDRAERADQKGAFQTLAEHGWGKFLLWTVVVGFFGYAVWLATDAAWGHRHEPEQRKRMAARVESGAKVVFYVLLAILVVTGSGGNAGGETFTAKVLKMTGGQVLVGVAGGVILGMAAVQFWRGVKTKFAETLNLFRLRPAARSAVVALGKVGYIARGIVFALVGILVIAAAVTFDPQKARGFDAALRELVSQPYGPWLLGTIAVGLACFGTYSFAEARYRRL